MLEDYQDLIDELLGTPQIVRDAIASGDQAAVAIVLAMRARDRLVLERLQRMKNSLDPHFRDLPDVAALAANEPAPESSELLSTFDTARGDLVSLLMNLTLRDWERTATTDSQGIITVAQEVEAHVEFDEVQRARLQALNA
jgi:hypothetical protein